MSGGGARRVGAKQVSDEGGETERGGGEAAVQSVREERGKERGVRAVRAERRGSRDGRVQTERRRGGAR